MRGVQRVLRFKLRKSPAEVDAVLRGLVRHAYSFVPFYRRYWDSSGSSVACLRVATDLPKLPIVTKRSILAEGTTDRLAVTVNDRRTVSRSTSGTSGAPIEVRLSQLEFRYRQLVLLLALTADARSRLPLTLVEAGAWVPPDGLGTSRVHRHLGVKVVYLSRRVPLFEQLAALLAQRPDVLTGCPSSLEIIASELRRLRLAPPRPRVVVTRGEVLRPCVRRLLGDTFACSVIDYYNAQEIGHIARQCPDDPRLMHVNADTCVIEIVDASGKASPIGEEGRVVATNLYSMTMPFIRYALEDRASLLREPGTRCSCGSRSQTITAPIGRDDDLLILPGEQRVSPRLIDDLVIAACRVIGLDSRFTRGIRDYQIVQKSQTQIVIRFASQDPPPTELSECLTMSVAAIHPDVRCSVEWTPEIPLAPSGKRRRVVSRWIDLHPDPTPTNDPL